MKNLIFSTVVLFLTLSSANAAPAQEKNDATKEIFTANKRDYNDRMYLYLYCLANTEFQNDLEKASERCQPILNKSNAYDAKGLEDRITANVKPLNADIKDMLSCLTKEANSTSNLSDSSAISYCEVMVNPTSGIEL